VYSFRASTNNTPASPTKFYEEGNVKRFINIFVNDDEIRTLQGIATPIQDSDRVSIVPAMAGGE
jgi:sulfur-carrier protein